MPRAATFELSATRHGTVGVAVTRRYISNATTSPGPFEVDQARNATNRKGEGADFIPRSLWQRGGSPHEA